MTTGYRMSILVGDEGLLNLEHLYVALLDEETESRHSKASKRSVLGKIAWRHATRHPCGPWYYNNRGALVSSLPFSETTENYVYGNAEHTAKLIPLERTHAFNLWEAPNRQAMASILGSAIRTAIEKHAGIEYRYDKGGGVLMLEDPSVLADYYPEWSHATKQEVAQLWMIEHGPKLKNTDIPIFKPYRVIEVRPGVGLRGQPLLHFGLGTRMETDPRFNLQRIIDWSGVDWTRTYQDKRFSFRLSLPSQEGLRVYKDTGTWLIDDMSSRTVGESMNEGVSALVSLRAWLNEYGIELAANEISKIKTEKAVHVRRHSFESDETLVVPARYLIPTVDFGNAYFYTKFSDKDLDSAYSRITQIETRFKAAMLECISTYLAETLDVVLDTPTGPRKIRFGKGPWESTASSGSARGATKEERRERLTGQATLFELKKPHALLRRHNTYEAIDLAGYEPEEREEEQDGHGLLQYVYQGDFRVYRAAPQLAAGLKLAIIAPGQKTTGAPSKVAELLPATFRFDADSVLGPAKRNAVFDKGRRPPLINLPSRMESIRSFFDTKPMDAFFQPLAGDRGDVAAYLDAMGEARNNGAEAFIVILPAGVQRRVQDAIYFATSHFGFSEQKPVVHFREGNWTTGTTYYAMLYGALAKLNTRLGGLNYKVDLTKTVPLFADKPNVLVVAYDFGRERRNHVGIITSTDTATQDMIAHRTQATTSFDDAIDELDRMLATLVRKNNPDLLVVLRDSKFNSAEMRGLKLNFENFGVPTLPIETLKSGGLAGYKYTPRGQGRKIKIVAPYAQAFYTPEMHINVFGSNAEIKNGIWNAIRFAVHPQPYPLELDFDYEDIANIGFGLAKMGGYFNDPAKTKYPDILGRADKLVDLYEGGALSGIDRQISAREFDP